MCRSRLERQSTKPKKKHKVPVAVALGFFCSRSGFAVITVPVTLASGLLSKRIRCHHGACYPSIRPALRAPLTDSPGWKETLGTTYFPNTVFGTRKGKPAIVDPIQLTSAEATFIPALNMYAYDWPPALNVRYSSQSDWNELSLRWIIDVGLFRGGAAPSQDEHLLRPTFLFLFQPSFRKKIHFYLKYFCDSVIRSAWVSPQKTPCTGCVNGIWDLEVFGDPKIRNGISSFMNLMPGLCVTAPDCVHRRWGVGVVGLQWFLHGAVPGGPGASHERDGKAAAQRASARTGHSAQECY